MYPFRFFSTIILFFSFSILVAQDPPANNDPDDAIKLTVQSESCENKNTATKGTFANASHSGETFDNDDCVTYAQDSQTTPTDVWYKVTVPESGAFNLYAEGDAEFEGEGSLAAVFFTESGDDYTRFDCGADIYSSAEFKISDRTAGETIYIQLLSNGELFGYGIDLSTLEFDICAYDPGGTLDLPQTQKPLLSYYSNPVGNSLAIESPYQIQALQVFDLMGKEVLHKTPNQQKLTLNTYTLAPGAYLLRVATPEGQQTVKLIKK